MISNESISKHDNTMCTCLISKTGAAFHLLAQCSPLQFLSKAFSFSLSAFPISLLSFMLLVVFSLAFSIWSFLLFLELRPNIFLSWEIPSITALKVWTYFSQVNFLLLCNLNFPFMSHLNHTRATSSSSSGSLASESEAIMPRLQLLIHRLTETIQKRSKASCNHQIDTE